MPSASAPPAVTAAVLPSLAVFTVKKVARVRGVHHTYGGFGDYVRSLLPHFRSITLCCHVQDADDVPAGWYPLVHDKLHYHGLPNYRTELGCLLWLPWMLLRCFGPARAADILNPRVPDYTGICGGLWGRLLRKPLFISQVDDWHSRIQELTTSRRGLVRWLLRQHLRLYCRCERWLCRRGLLFAQGEKMHAFYAANPERVLCVSSTIGDGDLVAALPARPPGGTFTLLAIGRLVHVKAHADLLAALALAQRQLPDRRLALQIAGEGPLLEALQQQARALGLGESVRFLGQLGRAEVFLALDAADAFCLPSHSEGTPKVILEAMARGVPVVATDVGGVATVVQHERTGLLVPPRQPAALAQALLRLAGDAELRRRCASAALQVARQHTLGRESERMLQALQRRYPQLWPLPAQAGVAEPGIG